MKLVGYPMRRKTFLTAFFYATLEPLSVWIGYELGLGAYLLGITLIVLAAFLEFLAVTFWIDAQTDSIQEHRH